MDGIDCLAVKDNGIGMNQHIIDGYYTNIGSSYYKSREFYALMAETNSSFVPISRFGIGILACFMVCDNLEVVTRRVSGRYQCDEALKIVVEGYDSLFTITDSNKAEPGTDTVLQLRKTHPWDRMNSEEFSNSIKMMVPLPPFAIDIVTDDKQEVHSSESFNELDLSLLQDYSWDNKENEDNVETITIDITSDQYGFKGSACVGYIVRRGMPVKEIELQSKEVLIDNEAYTLSCDIVYGNNCIKKETTSIEVKEDGKIESQKSYHEITKSKASLSIHGIEVPCKLFPDYSSLREKSVLHLPFPITFRLDIGGHNDLNLNSARSQIIYDDKWLQFEEAFFSVVCKALHQKMELLKWNAFKDIMVTKLNSSAMVKVFEVLK